MNGGRTERHREPQRPFYKDAKTYLNAFYGLFCWKNIDFACFLCKGDDGWTDGRTDGSKFGQMMERRQSERRTDRQIDRRTDGWKVR